MTEARPDIATMPFEAALAELEQIVDQLEKGAVALTESIRLYERGEALRKSAATNCSRTPKCASRRSRSPRTVGSREWLPSTTTDRRLKARRRG